MGQYRKKPIVIEAHQWHKNGDHPQDYEAARDGLETREGKQVLVSFSGEYARAHEWEGGIVRYFRRPDVAGHALCDECGKTFHVHGWIDTKEDGHRVCPGDWIITGVAGEMYPCKPGIFAATYDPA